MALDPQDIAALTQAFENAMKRSGGGTAGTAGPSVDFRGFGAAGAEKQLEAMQALLESINSLQADKNALTAKESDLLDSIRDTETSKQASLAEQFLILEKQRNSLGDFLRLAEGYGASQTKIDAQQKIADEAHETYLEARKSQDFEATKEARLNLAEQNKKLKILEAQKAEREDLISVVKRGIKESERLTHENEKQSKALAFASDKTEGVIGLLGLSSRAYEGSFFQKVKEGGITNSLAAMGNTFLQSLRPMNLIANVGGKLMETFIGLVTEVDTAQATFQKATGAGASYNEIITNTISNNTKYGVTGQQAAQANTNLFQQFRGFTEIAPQARQAVADLTVQLEAVGVDSATSAQSFNLLTSALNRGTAQAGSAIMKLQGAASALGISFGEMQQQFGQAMSTVAVYGERAEEQFIKLAAAAKMAGVEVNDLIGFAKQFDTFQGAAESVSRLNALLGGPYLNSLQMVHMTEAERHRATLVALEASGKQFAMLSRFEQRAIASAAGITDMAKANQILGKSTAAYDQMQAKGAAAAMTQKELAEQARQAQAVTQEFANILRSIAVIVGPVVSVLNWLISSFANLTDMPLVNLSATVIALGLLFWGISKAMGKFRTSTEEAGSSLGDLGEILTQIKDIMVRPNSPPLYLIFPVMARGINSLSESFERMGPKALLGALAIGAVAAGASLLFNSIAKLFTAMKDLTGEQILGGLGALALAFGGLLLMVYALANPMAMLGALVLGGLFFSIGAAMEMAGPGLEGLAGTFDGMDKMTPAKAKSTVEAMDSVTRVIDASAFSRALSTGALMDFVKEVLGVGGEETTPEAPARKTQKEIKLYMDTQGRREFAKGIVDEITDEMSKKLNIVKR
jgi:hypothetical protein